MYSIAYQTELKYCILSNSRAPLKMAELPITKLESLQEVIYNVL